jgi:hypothetical protein
VCPLIWPVMRAWFRGADERRQCWQGSNADPRSPFSSGLCRRGNVIVTRPKRWADKDGRLYELLKANRCRAKNSHCHIERPLSTLFITRSSRQFNAAIIQCCAIEIAEAPRDEADMSSSVYLLWHIANVVSQGRRSDRLCQFCCKQSRAQYWMRDSINAGSGRFNDCNSH